MVREEDIIGGEVIPFSVSKIRDSFGVDEINSISRDRVRLLLDQALKQKGVDKKDLLEEMIKISKEKDFLDLEIEHDIEDLIGSEWIESIIEEDVLEYFKSNPNYITGGTEGEIYKMNIPGKGDVVVIKKIHENHSKDNIEFENHYKFKELEKELAIRGEDNIVKIPTPIHHFFDGKAEYIIMENIPGKTLYAMILEKIVEEDALKYLSKIRKEQDKKDFLYMMYLYIDGNLSLDEFNKMSYEEVLDFITDEDGYIKPVSFEDDTKAEGGILQLYKMLHEFGVIDEEPTKSEIVGGKRVNVFLDKKMKDVMFNKGLGVFTRETKDKLISGIRVFIKEMHNKGLYHRDIGGNPRNLMFVQMYYDFFIPYFIDFGKSTDKGKEDFDIYHDFLTGGDYLNDEWITTNFMTNLDKGEKVKLVDKEKESTLDALYSVGEKFGIKSSDIDLSYTHFTNVKKIVYYNSLKDIFVNGKTYGGFILDLGKKGNKDENSRVFSEILTLIFLTKEENFGKIEGFIDGLIDDEEFKLSFKDKIISIYKNIYKEISNIRK